MFVGHYGIALAAAGGRTTPTLAAGFLAVQAIDFGFFGLALAGVERWRPAPEAQGLNPFELTFMPFTHGLAGVGVWALVCGLIAAALAPRGRRRIRGAVIGLLVLSHWGLDLVVHRPDLPLLADSGTKLGLGLWERPPLAIALELAVLAGGLVLYARRTRARAGPGLGPALLTLTLALLGLQAFNWFGPALTDPVLFPVAGLAAYAVATVLAVWNDRTRAAR